MTLVFVVCSELCIVGAAASITIATLSRTNLPPLSTSISPIPANRMCIPLRSSPRISPRPDRQLCGYARKLNFTVCAYI